MAAAPNLNGALEGLPRVDAVNLRAAKVVFGFCRCHDGQAWCTDQDAVMNQATFC